MAATSFLLNEPVVISKRSPPLRLLENCCIPVKLNYSWDNGCPFQRHLADEYSEFELNLSWSIITFVPFLYTFNITIVRFLLVGLSFKLLSITLSSSVWKIPKYRENSSSSNCLAILTRFNLDSIVPIDDGKGWQVDVRCAFSATRFSETQMTFDSCEHW